MFYTPPATPQAEVSYGDRVHEVVDVHFPSYIGQFCYAELCF
jgi:hypothetical protein